MKRPCSFPQPDARRLTRRVQLSLLLAFVMLVCLVAGGTLAAAPRSPEAGHRMTAPLSQSGTQPALYAIFLDEARQLSQVQAAGLVVYSHNSSIQGDYLLVGAAPQAADGAGAALRLLDDNPSGASYYLAYPAANGGAVTWADYGRRFLCRRGCADQEHGHRRLVSVHRWLGYRAGEHRYRCF